MKIIIHIGRATLSAIGILTLLGCVGERSYERVDEPPAGAQIDSLASSFHAVIRTPHVRYLYSASYADVWAAANEVMTSLKETGSEPQLTTDEENGVLVLGLDHRDDAAKTMDNPNPIRIKGWREELRLEFMRRPNDRTMIVVSRLVLGVPYNRRCTEYTDPCPTLILFEPEISNGQIERWVLTRIREAVAKQIIAKANLSPAPSADAPQEPALTPHTDQPKSVIVVPASTGSAPEVPTPIPSSVLPAAAAVAPAPISTAPEPSTATPPPDPQEVTATSPAPSSTVPEEPVVPSAPDPPAATTTTPVPSSIAPEESAAAAAPASASDPSAAGSPEGPRSD